jgi:hypothetical protein
MSFDGSGNFNLSYNWVDDYNLAILIDPTRMMGQENDIASGLSLCITRDGQGVPTTNISWNNFRLTDLADPVVGGDAVSLGFADARYMQIGGATDNRYLLRDGTLAMTGAANMGGFQINNLGAPTSAGDAATKTYVDAVAATGSAAVSLVSSTLIVNYFGGF